MKGFKKAFTIVELVIVIAVIAILAAVLIPTFSNIIRKANISNDTQLVRNLNTALVVDRAVNGEHKTMQSALDAAFDAGYDLAKINARANQNEILWDSKNDVFCYYNDDTKEIEYIPEFPGHDPVGQNEQYLFWKIYSATPEAQKYSIYWNSNSNFTPSLKVGFDAGKSTGVTSLNYVGSGSAQDVVIRTNGGTLTVNAPLDTVKHYGNAEKIDVVAIANASYHENGTVQLIAVKQGHVKLEGDADVNGIYVYNNSTSDTKDDSFKEIKITVDSGVEVPKLSRSAVEIADEGTKVCTIVTDQAKDVYLFNEGIYEQIKTVDEGKPISDASATWADDSAKNTANTQTAAMQLANEFNGSYDGNGKIADQVVEVTGDNAGTYTVKFNQDTREFETYQGDTIVTEAAIVEAVAEVAEVSSEAGKTVEEAAVASALKGTGTQADPFLIYDYETMQKISDFYDKGYYYFAVDMSKTDNGKIDCTNWISIDLNGAFDGKGVNLTNLDNTLFRYVDGVGVNDETTINNFDIYQCRIVKTGSNAAVAVYGSKNLTIENVNISGYIEGQGQVGTYIFYPGSGVLTFKDCTSTTTNVAIGQPAAGFVVNPYNMLTDFGGTAESKIVLNNSYFEGKLKTTSGNSTTPNGAYVYAHNVNIPVEFVNNTKTGLYSESTRSGFNSKYWYTSEKTYFIPAVKYDSAITNPDANFGSTLTINRYNESIVKATVSLFISPNAANNESGSYTGTYFTETLDVSNSTFTTSVVKKINVAINGSIDGYTLNQISTDKTEVSNNTLNIVNSYYGHTHNGVTIYIVQYDSDNEAVAYTSWTYISATTGSGNYRVSISYTRKAESYTAYYYGNSKESVETIGTYIQNNYASGYNAENIAIVYQQKSGNKWSDIG